MFMQITFTGCNDHMETPKLKVRNLFTLNRDSNVSSNNHTDNNSNNYSSSGKVRKQRPPRQPSYSSEEEDITYEQATQLRLSIRGLQKKQGALMGVISDLENQMELVTQKFSSSEAKTKELIQKLSKQQVQCKELEYKLHVMEDDLGGQYQNVDSMNRTIAELALTLKTVVEAVGQEPQKMKEALERVLSLGLDINVHEPLRHLRDTSSNKEAARELEKLKADLEHERSEKQRILPAYNQLLNKMRTNCSVLKDKVDEVYRKADSDKELLERLVAEKEETIRELTSRNLELMNSRSQLEEPRAFIGDWKKNKLQKELSQIDREILEIENNLQVELESSRKF